LSDSACASLAQGAHDIMEANIGDLTGYVAPEDLETLKSTTEDFRNMQGTSELVHEVSPTLTKAFVDSFKPVKDAIETLKLLVRDYEATNIEFYNRFMASTVIPAVAVRHTYVSIHATGANSGNAVEGAVFTLTNAKKSGTTDWEGNALIAEVKQGKDVLTGVKKNNEGVEQVIYTGHIEIKRGKTNLFELKIAGM
jgi:hypothetical protein